MKSVDVLLGAAVCLLVAYIVEAVVDYIRSRLGIFNIIDRKADR